MDGDALDEAVGGYLARRAQPAPGEHAADAIRRAIAVDGKTVRGSRAATTRAVTLLAAMDHTGTVLADRSNKIPAFAPLLDPLDLTGAMLTADALHTQHDHGAYLRRRGAHYLVIVKENHPGLYDRVRRLPWRDIGLDHYDRSRAHHRDEIRRLKTAAFRRLPRRPSGPPDRASEAGAGHREADHRARLPDHQPAAWPGIRRSARLVDQKPLGYRDPSAPRP
ncbi:transposase [Streptomyces sp. NPDC004629]|uniref:transposase n=1 Tax=Streptomyces sp. NPDC004629 TaxID=3364705 RepID=UPI003678E524